MWLDSHLNFGAYFRERLQKAKIAEARIRGLSKTYWLSSALVQRIQIATMQSIALYEAELWWKNQKTYQIEIQKLINRQARSITGMYSGTPIGALMSESGLIPAYILLDFRQCKYAYRLLSLPDSIPTKAILPITLRIGDEHAQPEDQPKGDEIWATHQKVKSYSQHLARQVTIRFCVDPADGVEPVRNLEQKEFSGKISIQEPKTAISDAQKNRSDLALWSDGSRLESGKVSAAVVWKNTPSGCWQSCKLVLGKNKEVLDAELWGLSEALGVVLKETALRNSHKVIVFSYSQTAIRKLQGSITGAGQALRAQIVKRTKLLQARGSEVTIQWVPSHSKIEENERANKAAKEAAIRGKTTAK